MARIPIKSIKVKNPKPRQMGPKELSMILSKLLTERNTKRDRKNREYRPKVMKSFFKDYMLGLLSIAVDKGAIADTTKNGLGSIHVMQFPSKNGMEWDKKNRLVDCKIVSTHIYKHADIVFDDSFRQRALKNINNGREYLKKKYNHRWHEEFI